MNQSITMDQAGRIVLPKEVRRRLNLGPGARLMLDVVAQRIELTPEPQAEEELVPTVGKRMVLRPTGKAFDATAATRAEREAQSRRGEAGAGDPLPRHLGDPGFAESGRALSRRL